MIRSITVENYKAFKNRTTIEIRPITILVGPNSAGKSSILRALDLLGRSFTKGPAAALVHVDRYGQMATGGMNLEIGLEVAMDCPAGQNDIDGSFDALDRQNLSIRFDNAKQICEWREGNRHFTIANDGSVRGIVDWGNPMYMASILPLLDPVRNDLDDVFRLAYGGGLEDAKVLDILMKRIEGFVKFQSQGNGLSRVWNVSGEIEPYVISAAYHLEMHGEELNSEYDNWFSHYFTFSPSESGLERDDASEILALDERNPDDISLSDDEDMTRHYLESQGPLDKGAELSLRELNRRVELESILRIRRRHRFTGLTLTGLQQCARIMKETPHQRSALVFGAWLTIDFLVRPFLLGLVKDQAKLHAVRVRPVLENAFGAIRYIPPLRPTPESSYSLEMLRQVISGEKNLSHIMPRLNDELDKLGIGCRISVNITERKENPVELRIHDILNGAILDYDNVGVGLSQLVPILVALANPPGDIDSLVMVEQPELHLHPRIQSRLAELFVEHISDRPEIGSPSRRAVVIETHSEHLVRGFQVLVAKGKLSCEDIAVQYVDKGKEGLSHIVQLRLDECGLFVDPWPEGFFDQGFNQTMEIIEAGRK